MSTAAWPLVGRADELGQGLQALSEVHGAVLSGAAGVGKSRLAAELLRRAEAQGWTTLALSAGSETVAAPFAPFAGLLAGDHSGDHIARFLRAGQALSGGGERVLVWVDDAQHLDDVSVAFVRHLVTATSVRVVLTVRSGSTVPPTLVALWQAGQLRRIEVLALARDETERLLRMVLEGEVQQSVIDRTWQTTRGNPLFVHELVHDALDRGALVRKDGWWTFVGGESGAGARLQEIVAARVGSVSAEEREAIELAALGEPVELEMLGSLVGPEVVARLEDRGLLVVRTAGRRAIVQVAHPLHREVVRATMNVTAGRARRRQLIDATTALGATGDLRVAVWRCEIGDVADWESLLAAAEQLVSAGGKALISVLDDSAAPAFVPSHDHLVQAATLAQGALDGGGGAAAAALLVRLLVLLGESDEAAVVHQRAIAEATDEAERSLLGRMYEPHLYFFNHQEGTAARTWLRDYAERTSDPTFHTSAAAALAMAAALGGAPDEALALADAVREGADAARHDRLLSDIAASISLGEAGRITEALERADAAFHGFRPGDGTDLAAMIPLVRCLLLASAGQVEEAEDLVRACYAVASETGDRPGMGLSVTMAAHVAMERGHFARAGALASEAAARLAEADPHGLRATALAYRAHAAAVTGNVGPTIRDPDAPVRSEERRALAWIDVALGRPSLAVARLQASAEIEAAGGRLTREVAALHDLARLGHGSIAHERLGVLAGLSDSAVVATMHAQAAAEAASDPAGLAAAAERWAAMAFDLFAAEAWSQAANRYERTGRAREAARARNRSDAALVPCGPVVTPALLRSAPQVGLTRREREIAGLAAQGLADKEIAEQLFVSVRTVHTHLYNAYVKLGIEGRAGLADALGGD